MTREQEKAQHAKQNGEVHYCPNCKTVQPVELTSLDPDDIASEPDLIVCLVCKESIGFIENL